MFYTKDENNKITASAEFKWSEDCLETTQTIIRGYDGALYFADECPVKPIELIKEEKRSELSAARDLKIEQGCEFNGLTFYADKGSRGDLVFAILAFQNVGELTPQWKAMNGVVAIESIEDLIAISTAVGTFVEVTYATFFNYFAQIEAATTSEELENLQFIF